MQYCCEACRCPQDEHGDEISTRGWATKPGGKLCTAFQPRPIKREPPTSDIDQRAELYRKWQECVQALRRGIPAITDGMLEREARRRTRRYHGGPSHEVLAILFFPGRGSVLVDIGS